jgi:hypothetical protein
MKFQKKLDSNPMHREERREEKGTPARIPCYFEIRLLISYA